jgi:hypothetical protein
MDDLDDSEATSRLHDELALLDAMYPGHVSFNPRSRDFKYTSTGSDGAAFVVRVPEKYPVGHDADPLIISASDHLKRDIRDTLGQALGSLVPDEKQGELLDLVISLFEQAAAVAKKEEVKQDGGEKSTTNIRSKTVVIWLHHLLATSKRKLAVSPTTKATVDPGATPDSVSGITKPGYPGIMVFSGRSDLVDAHVRELKDLNWQAFQIRYDSAEERPDPGTNRGWDFTHGQTTIVEVQTMAEVVGAIATEENRKIFLQAVGVK